MKRIRLLLLTSLLVFVSTAFAVPDDNSLGTLGPASQPTPPLPQATSQKLPLLNPTPPHLDAKGFILIDANSGQILAENNADEQMEPASLTKMMTILLAEEALANGRIHLDDNVLISKKAWEMGGSKMFVKVGTEVPVKDLLRGIIVASGNDACVALAEYIGGTEDAFVNMMNAEAQQLGMTHTHFGDCTGLSRPDHYTTPRDMAIWARALVTQYPEYYSWFKEKWYTYNGIRQPNRNRLLWRTDYVDGIKTGHTSHAGFCLVASGEQNGTRLISVVMGTPTDEARNNEAHALLNFGFQFYETHKLFSAEDIVTEQRVFKGQVKKIAFGVASPLYVTLQHGQYQNIHAQISLRKTLVAPIEKGNTYGTLNILLGQKVITSTPLVALSDDPVGSWWTRFADSISLFFHHHFG